VFNAFAENIENLEVQKECYNNVLKNIKKLDPIWNEWYKDIFNKKYSFINKNLSKKYKNMSSFWIDLDTPNFEMKVYSFGKQTWYVHPPYSPYPVSTKTEKWITPAKEFIYAEEYIKTQKWESKFLGCSFMNIDSSDLMNVKSKSYAYDWDIISIIQEEKDWYKAWYNENISYNFDNKPFVTWKRLFIFPKETKNKYFDKYSVLNAFPSNKVDDFSKIFEKRKLKDWEGDAYAIRVYETDSRWHIINAIAPDVFMPVKLEGNNKIFSLNSYYQEIENNFPEFWEHLALRWELHYDILKEVISTKDNKKYAHIWNTILDPLDITKYSLEKKQWKLKEKIEFYEENLEKIWKTEKEVKQMLKEDKENNKKELNNKSKEVKKGNLYNKKEQTKSLDSEKKQTKSLDSEKKQNNNLLYILLIVLFILTWSFVYYKTKKK